MKKAWYAVIDIDEAKLYERENSIELITIFGSVYAPKSKVLVQEIRSTFKAVSNGEHTGTATVIVPSWVFTNKGLNPCQMVKGYRGKWSQGKAY